VEMYNKLDKEWMRIYYWEGDRASFKWNGVDTGPDDEFPYLWTAFELAAILKAKLCDMDDVLDREEVYRNRF
jgi:hypothetical protein